MNMLVTGATGFVGAAVARHLCRAGHHVRVLVRPASDRRNLAGLPVEPVTGDLTDPLSIAAAVRGCDALFHVAADYRLWVRDPALMMASNVQGTRNLMVAAADAGVSRIVYTSSVATLGVANGTVADETTPTDQATMIGPYKQSKYLAELGVLRLVREEGLPAIIVNPSTPVGPGDIKPTPTGRMIVEALAGRMPVYVNTGLNIVHVDDVAAGHLLALEKGVIGERYILGGDNMTLCEILLEIAAIAGRRPPLARIPVGVAFAVALLAEGWSRLANREPFVTLDSVRMARKTMFYSSEKAIQALGYAPREARQALSDAVGWFRRTHDRS
jgi:dihydroflavonol-4-reductase